MRWPKTVDEKDPSVSASRTLMTREHNYANPQVNNMPRDDSEPILVIDDQVTISELFTN